MKHLILLLLLALITMVGCLSPDMKDIDPIVDETTPPDREGEEEGFVLLPDPFGVVDRSGETRSIDLLVPGATQSIEWKVDDEFRFANIYLYNKGTLYKTIAENIDNVGKYEWKSEEALEMAHNYEVIVSQHNGKPDENPYLTGYKSSEFSMYPSAVKIAKALVERIHNHGETEQEKRAMFIGYFKLFLFEGVSFMKGGSGGGRGGYEEPIEFDDPSWVTDPMKKMLWEMANQYNDGNPNDDSDVEAFLLAIAYLNVYNEDLRDALASLLEEFGYTGGYGSNGDYHLTNPTTGGIIDIDGSNVHGSGGLDNVSITYHSGDGHTVIEILFQVNIGYSGGHKTIKVFHSIKINEKYYLMPHEEDLTGILYNYY